MRGADVRFRSVEKSTWKSQLNNNCSIRRAPQQKSPRNSPILGADFHSKETVFIISAEVEPCKEILLDRAGVRSTFGGTAIIQVKAIALKKGKCMRNLCAPALAILCFCAAHAAFARSSANSPLTTVVANDNRTAAGELKGNVLNLHLELREARWYPEKEGGAYHDAYVFAEEGRAPQNPGPLIRVPQGTEIHASVRNSLAKAVKVYGLHQYPGDAKDAIAFAPGESREVQFAAGDPGTYLYWAATDQHSLDRRNEADTMLSGAFIVDPPGAKPDDRIFVLSIWTTGDLDGAFQEIPALNGKSWPYAERVTYKMGDTIHWRVLNASLFAHAMHLHGFFFDVDGAGDGERFERLAADQRRKEVTEMIDVGHTFDMTWTPDRAGNWLFHCHMVAHMTPAIELHPPAPEAANYSRDHDHASMDPVMMMGGIVLGITIQPGSNPPPAVAASASVRHLQLLLSENPAKTPSFKIEVKDPAAPAPAKAAPAADAPPYLLGPPIVITRGETTEIEVKNETKTATTIHWHGIELESYYDGVAGWTGSGNQITPAIEPGKSFVAKMTPPRAGTFIYHTHWHDEQLLNGVYGPLIVLEPGQKYDPDHDQTFVFGVGNYPPFGFELLMNGQPQPDIVRLHSGTKYRFRLINIGDNDSDLRVRLMVDDSLATWKVVAKDGADYPPAQLKSTRADMYVTVGQTFDVEYQSDKPGFEYLEIWEPAYPVRATMPLKFAAAQ